MERRGVTVCRECMMMLRQSKRPTQLRVTLPFVQQWTGRSFVCSTQTGQLRRQPTIRRQTAVFQSRVPPNTRQHATSITSKDLSTAYQRILTLTSTALKPEDNPIPSEQRILYILEQLDALAQTLIDARSVAGARAAREEDDTTATSALLGSVNARQSSTHHTKASLLNLISSKAEEMLRHPNIFITPAILKSYVDLQTALHQPSSFPDIFYLYANKPAPSISKTSGKITYAPVNPQKINAAVPTATASTALSAAIASHNLPLTLDIIATTYSTPAFRRSKLLRKAIIPFSGLTLTPLAAYTLSLQYSLYLQSTMSTPYATGIAFAGIMTYVGTVAGLGYVVITTANDQMERVTWAKGVPLWERWVREEEREALDRVAAKWGFQEVERRGDEEGGEWEGLREEVGRKGMVLDRVELMEGME